MKHQLRFFFCLILALCADAAFAQFEATKAHSNPGSPAVAYVYVASSKTANVNQIYAFAAAPDGKLTAVSGSPFLGDVSSMAVNREYLFGADPAHVYIHSFSIEPDGGLKPIASISAQKYNSGECGSLGPLFLDRTGRTLYDLDVNGNACANNTYQSFRIGKPDGALDYLGSEGADAWFDYPLSFVGNNTYAYGAVCLYDMYWEIYGFQRHSDGMLTEANISVPTPTAPGEDFYCPSLTAADATNHVVISLQAVDGVTFNPDGRPQLAAYTAESSGNLSTTSTRDNMPDTAVGGISDLAISPSGKLLAVGGTAGLQVFHFNGSDPITHYTGLLTTDDVSQFFWDNDNHLYAISASSGKLYVFTVTPANVTQAPGSPYEVGQPTYVSVLPRT
jgi:WD40 repeat protein